MITGSENGNTISNFTGKLKDISDMLRPAFLAMIFISNAIILSSCERKTDKIPHDEILTLPSITVKDFETLFSDSGKVQLIMISPLMESYNNAEEPYSEFRYGIKVIFYDGLKEPVAIASSKYTRYNQKKKLWELRDSVIVENDTGDKLETEILFWDQDKDFIYTDRLVKITNEYQTVIGTGFESDTRLTKRKIKNITATIYLREDQ